MAWKWGAMTVLNWNLGAGNQRVTWDAWVEGVLKRLVTELTQSQNNLLIFSAVFLTLVKFSFQEFLKGWNFIVSFRMVSGSDKKN
jgi:hypothetical protein